jgi:hypothetical protein
MVDSCSVHTCLCVSGRDLNVLGRYHGSYFKVTPIVDKTGVGSAWLKVRLAVNEAYRFTNCSRNTGCVHQSFVFDSRQGHEFPLLQRVQIASGTQAASYAKVAGVCFPSRKAAGA